VSLAKLKAEPVPVAPEVGSPEFCQTPFLAKYNLLLVLSIATPIISPAVKVSP
jgi:hypothetical protein